MDQMPDLNQLMKLARSPAGQQLLQILQQQGGADLETAARQASSGNFEQAKQTLSALLSTEEARKLLHQLEEET